jgi:hypothetical protein
VVTLGPKTVLHLLSPPPPQQQERNEQQHHDGQPVSSERTAREG